MILRPWFLAIQRIGVHDSAEPILVEGTEHHVRRVDGVVQYRLQGSEAWQTLGTDQASMIQTVYDLQESGVLETPNADPPSIVELWDGERWVPASVTKRNAKSFRAVTQATDAVALKMADEGTTWRRADQTEHEDSDDETSMTGKDAILVALVRHKATKRADVFEAAKKMSTEGAVKRAMCVGMCDETRGGHGLWTISDGVYAVTAKGEAAFRKEFDKSVLVLTTANDQRPAVVEAEASFESDPEPNATAQAETVESLLSAASDVMTVLREQSDRLMADDAVDAEVDRRFAPGMKVTQLLGEVREELGARMAECTINLDRVARAKRKLEECAQELREAIQSGMETSAKSKRADALRVD